ncbi:unnamed protein product [Protopolystoma xenopodis]|uniref:Fibronectin type-III domain-containing protein n=1 Tax=Protopolystoma xenopodis TaxID=117903 RepID=A0A3S5FF44_9PLAT|nr:unnamed protein product [Protopolystoma xenopodis]
MTAFTIGRHYLVEKMDSKKGRWETVSEVTRGTQCPVNRLEEGNRYLFRVTAVSKEGPSEPCETTTETLAKNPFGKWRIVLTQITYFSCLSRVSRLPVDQYYEIYSPYFV